MPCDSGGFESGEVTLPRETSWEGYGSIYLSGGASLGPLASAAGSRESERVTRQGMGPDRGEDRYMLTVTPL